MKRLALNLLAMTGLFSLITGCSNTNEKMKHEFDEFIANYEARVRPLQKEANLAYWNASITGNDEDYARSEKLQLQLNEIYANKADFATLRKIRESNTLTDPLKKRQLEILYALFLGNQTGTELLARRIRMEVEIEKKFSNFRAEVNGNQLSDNQIEAILKNSTDEKELRSAWEAHKKIGPLVADQLIGLVKLRNKIAGQLGFANYHTMSLQLSEQDPAEISRLFDELDSLTRKTFAGLKDEIDTYLAARLKTSRDKLMPWDYQNRFFQEPPAIYSVDFDSYYAGRNIENLTSDYYTSIGLDIRDMLANSDLYEKPGKNQHAYCTDIDRAGDIRVLANIQPNYNWMSTMLHEFGHGVYDKYIDRGLPFTLRSPAHIFTTEAIAMLFGRMASNPQWLQDMKLIDSSERKKIDAESSRVLRLEQLTFSRWAQVMYRFEKALYENPDQDLNTLWWNLVEKYQMIRRPEGRDEPDWASKIHIATAPCYYHNYLLGELLASQLDHYITVNILKSGNVGMLSYYGSKATGKFLTENVFMPGASLKWNDMIATATGEKLTARYYAAQFLGN